METKVSSEWGTGRERVKWIERRGVKIFKVTIPKVHSGTVPQGTLNGIRADLGLSNEDFRNLCECPFTAEDFDEHADAELLRRSTPPMPEPVHGEIIDGDSPRHYTGYEIGRRRFAWCASRSGSFDVIVVFIEKNPERQWATLLTGLTETQARDRAALAYQEKAAEPVG
jgi:hypothetical protein